MTGFLVHSFGPINLSQLLLHTRARKSKGINRRGGPLQRTVSLHWKLGALDHGRSNPESQRQGQVHGVQRGQPSLWTAAAGSTSAVRIGGTANGRLAQQVMGRVLRAGCAEARLRFYCMQQRSERAVSLLDRTAYDGTLGNSRPR